MRYHEDRWYYTYIYMMSVTELMSLFFAWSTAWSTAPFIIVNGLMSIMCFILFVAEFTVMGATANAGGAFFTAATCFLIAHYVPFPVVS